MHRQESSKFNPGLVLLSSQRGSQGQSVVVLVLVIAVFIILAAGLFSFEINRVEVARSQLRSVTESAALAGGLSLASQGTAETAAAQSEAMQVALSMFRKNSVLDVALTDATLASTATDSPSPSKGSLFMELINPGTGQPVALGDPTGKTFNAVGAFCLQPSMAGFLNLPPVVLRIGSASGVPDLDIVICFDTSQSMDDLTVVYPIQRTRIGNVGPSWGHVAVLEATLNSFGSSNTTPATGSLVNGVYPQYLDALDGSSGNWIAGMAFYFNALARGVPNQGTPPVSQLGSMVQFTDLVVNLSPRITAPGPNNTLATTTNVGGYSFDSLCPLDEAYRGNLDSQAVWTAAGEPNHVNDSGTSPGTAIPAPQPGYQAEYFSLANQCLEPMSDMRNIVSQFMTGLQASTKAHFGLVAFAERAGTSPTDTFAAPNIAASYPAGGTGNFPLPNISVNQNQDNVTQINQALSTLVPLMGRNVGDAISQAIIQLQSSNSRSGAKKAIVIFTDGPPLSISAQYAAQNTLPAAIAAAQQANQAGIPIFTVVLAQNYQLTGCTDPDIQGMSALWQTAGHGGCQVCSEATSTLSSLNMPVINRQLVTLIQATVP